MNKLDLVAAIATLSMPFEAWGGESPPTLPEPAPSAQSASAAFDPANPNAGTLPFPEPAPGSGSDVPKSAFVILLPFIGLYLILRRRHRRIGG